MYGWTVKTEKGLTGAKIFFLFFQYTGNKNIKTPLRKRGLTALILQKKFLTEVGFQQSVFRFLPQMFYSFFFYLPCTFSGDTDSGADFFK